MRMLCLKPNFALNSVLLFALIPAPPVQFSNSTLLVLCKEFAYKDEGLYTWQHASSTRDQRYIFKVELLMVRIIGYDV